MPIRGVNTSADVFIKGKLPQTESEWLELEDVSEVFIDAGQTYVQSAVFDPASANVDMLTIYVGGVPRDAARRNRLPVVNKLFGYIAGGLSLASSVGVCFNWPGQGKSDGNILRTSITSRIELLSQLTKSFADKYSVNKINYVAASMGAYCAALTASEYLGDELHGLAFLSPAAYPVSSHDLMYDEGFGDAISQPWDIDGSPVFSALASTAVPTLVAYSEQDCPPIPIPVQESYRQLSGHNPHVTFSTIWGVAHNFRRIGSNPSGNVVDNDAVRSFGDKVVVHLEY